MSKKLTSKSYICTSSGEFDDFGFYHVLHTSSLQDRERK
jgi:hypothetical protein